MAHKRKPKRRSSPRRHRLAQRRRPAARRRRQVRLRVGRRHRVETDAGPMHRFVFKADVMRVRGIGRGGAFQACVSSGDVIRAEYECASARNPRVAVGKALRLMAGKLQGRKGAFAGA